MAIDMMGYNSLPVYVCIPYRYQLNRHKYYLFVLDCWKRAGYNVITADSDPDLPFSLAEARNNCVAKIEEENAVCIIIDADTFPEWDHKNTDVKLRLPWVEEAIRFARLNNKVIYPFTEYCYMKGRDLEALWPYCTPIYVMEQSVGGCVVTSKLTYEYLGKMDERFERTWGYEDNAFHAVASTLSTVIRLPGKIYSFEHEVDEGRVVGVKNPNFPRWQLYSYCYGKPELMRELIKR